jgi:hypothetical protein
MIFSIPIRKITFPCPRRIFANTIRMAVAINRCAFPDKSHAASHALDAEFTDNFD